MYRSIQILTGSSEMAKYKNTKSKKELEKEGRALGVELDRRHSKEDLIEELETIKAGFTHTHENVEHTHEDGTVHTHVDGDKKHTHKVIGEILKAPTKVKKPVVAAVKYVNKTQWDTKEAFAAAIDKTGLSADQVNVNSEWDLYQSNIDGYGNHLKLES